MNILIHQMGKVGSTTILHTLNASLPGCSIHSSHMLNTANFKKSITLLNLMNNSKSHLNYKQNGLSQLKRNASLAKELTRYEFIIISAIRNPFRHMISCLFQAADLLFPELFYDNVSASESTALIASKINRHFMNLVLEGKTPKDWEEHAFLVNFLRFHEWWREDFEPVHGLDIMSLDDPLADLWHIKRERRSILIYRFENINKSLPRIIQIIDPEKTFTQVNANITSAKPVGLLYKRFLSEYKIPEPMLAFYSTHQYTKKFYPDFMKDFLNPAHGVDHAK